MSVTHALILALARTIVQTNTHNRQPTTVTRHQGRQAPFHWHETPDHTQYVMRKIGYNKRTDRHVYQCPFCGGKAERPY